MSATTLTSPAEPTFWQYAHASSKSHFVLLHPMADLGHDTLDGLAEEDLALSQDETPSPSGSCETTAEITPECPLEDKSAPLEAEHIVRLSSIEHCMPRAYIRVCLAFAVPESTDLTAAVDRLRAFVRKIVDAKPYLSGYVMPAQDAGLPTGKVEIRFTYDDFINFPAIKTRHYDADEMPCSYSQLDQQGLPPSAIRPDLVSALPEGADPERAPVFRVQANVLHGGVVVSFYLHHCISDGTALGLLISGSVLHDDFTFERHLVANGHVVPDLNQRLAAFACQKTAARSGLSWSSPNQITDRRIAHNYFSQANHMAPPPKANGRGCVFSFPCSGTQTLKTRVEACNPSEFVSTNDVFQAFLWHHMTKARVPSLRKVDGITTSKLLIPVNVRSKVIPSLVPSYFGAAVDFAAAVRPLDHLCCTTDEAIANTAVDIRAAISQVDEPYVRASIALANSPNKDIDVRDLQASNMNRATGADMYITSWEKLPLYTSDLDMGLGKPDWVRKPWSKDPGSCIILPKDDRQDFLEAVIQMTEADMGRLLDDAQFMQYVSRVID